MKNGNIDLGTLSTQFSGLLKKLRGYSGLTFFLAVAVLYGFILWRINVYSSVPANQAEENAHLATQPHVDQTTVQKMLDLQDNSVNVQALFDQARQNPFQE